MLSRRRFLKLAGAGAAAMIASKGRMAHADLPLPPFPPDETGEDTLLSWNDLWGHPPMLGRLTANRMRIFGGPSPRAESIRNVYLHIVLPIYAAVIGERYDTRAWSPVWYYIGPNADGKDEYIHSAYVAPCLEVFNEPQPVDDWWWGEVTVPLTNQHYGPSAESYRYTWDYHRGFYTQMHKVIDSAVDDAGRTWYQIEDDIEPDRPAWMLARTLRRVNETEFAPINPDARDKRIIIDLNKQDLTCLEGSRAVFKTRIASGKTYQNEAGEVFDFRTAPGDYNILGKRPSRRMRGGEQQDLEYDINGVPWVTYFTVSGAAIHGAFWHNNYGMVRSHGCINVTADAAKWVYRWSQPYVPYTHISRFLEEEGITDAPVTPIEVIA